MRKLLTLAFLGLLIPLSLRAMEVKPEIDRIFFWYDVQPWGQVPRDTFVVADDTIYTPWIIYAGHWSEGTLFWATTGDAVGRIDSSGIGIQLAFVKYSNGVVDSTYQMPWDEFHHVVDDTISYKPLNELEHGGYIIGQTPCYALRARFYNPWDADVLTIKYVGVYFAGSQ